MWVAAYRHGRDVHPKLTDFPTFDAFVADYTGAPFPVVEHKMSPTGVLPADHAPCPLCAPAWSPIRADYRNNASVTEMCALVLDWDDVENPAMLVDAASPYVALIHTSMSHWRKPHRYRGIFPYAKPIPPGRHPRVFSAFASFFGSLADPVSKAPSAQYYIGRFADDPLPLFWRSPGTRFIDPWSLPGAETFTREDLFELAKRCKKDKKLAERFQRLAEGLPFAAPITEGDGRDAAAYRLCSVIAEHHPMANPEQVARLFGPSLQAMAFDHPDGALTHEKILDKLERLLSAATPQELAEETLQKQFWQAHGEPGRVGTYLPSELESLGSPGPREWVYQAEHGLYIRTIRGFDGPIRNATVRARQALSVVPSIGAYDFGPIQALASAHGAALVEVRQSLRAERATFDPATRVLTFAPTPRRALEPAPSAFVEAWFSVAFTPESRAMVEAWLTLLPRLERALACLMLVGETGAGKNLFAASASRFWLATPASAKRVLGRFNADVLKSPLVWADEELPKGHDGYFPREEFMHLIGADTFSVEQKGLEAIHVEGYTRWIATANNDLFTSAYSHSSEGNAALATRILRVQILPESAAFLQDAGRERLDTFVHTNELARHVLTLPVHESKERFGVVSEISFELELATGSTWGSRVCEILATWLLKTPRPRTEALIVEGARLWVNGARLYESWTQLAGMACARPKDARQLLECLRALCTPIRHDAKGRKQIGRLKYREIDMDKIRYWAVANDWAQVEAIDAALAPKEQTN